MKQNEQHFLKQKERDKPKVPPSCLRLVAPRSLSWGHPAPCSPDKPCPWLRLQNVHCFASLLQPAVARELLKVKKTAQDERGAAAEGWQAGGWWTGRGKGEGGERSRVEEGAGHGVGISSHLYHRAAAPCPVQACLLLVQLPLI